MRSIEDRLTECYVFVDEFLKAHPRLAHWRRSNHASPAFTDAEVIAIGLLQPCYRLPTLKDAYLLVASNCRNAVPRLCSYGQWIARLHALTEIIGHLIQAALVHHGMEDRLYLLYSKP